MKIKETYCTTCREVTEHSAQTDKNKEFVFTCQTCGHFFKVASDTDVKSIRAELGNREDIHKDLVTAEEEEKQMQEAEKILEAL